MSANRDFSRLAANFAVETITDTIPGGGSGTTTLSLSEEYEFVVPSVGLLVSAADLPDVHVSVTGFQTNAAGKITGVDVVFNNQTADPQDAALQVVGKLY